MSVIDKKAHLHRRFYLGTASYRTQISCVLSVKYINKLSIKQNQIKLIVRNVYTCIIR